MFTKEEIAKATRIAEYMTKAAELPLGKLEGNPNLWSDPMPRFNAPNPAFAGAKAPEGFMGSLGTMAKGMYRGAGGLAAATFTGQKGYQGAAEGLAYNTARLGRDMFTQGPRQAFRNAGNNFSHDLAAPYQRAWQNYKDDGGAQQAVAPAAWAGRQWKDLTTGPTLWGTGR